VETALPNDGRPSCDGVQLSITDKRFDASSYISLSVFGWYFAGKLMLDWRFLLLAAAGVWKRVPWVTRGERKRVWSVIRGDGRWWDP
jgi:hypothetical protein